MDEFEREINQSEEAVYNEPQPDNRKRRKLKKNFVKICIIILVLCICLLVYNLFGCNKKTIEDVYTFEAESHYQISEYNGKILTLNYDGVTILNANGQPGEVMENHMSNPHMNLAEDMILLYDNDNNKLTVYDGSKKLYSYECDQKIKNAKVNENGYTVLVSDEVGYNSRITVLNNKGNVEYIWQIGDEYIVDVDISPDSKKLVAASITTNTGEIVENIIFVDIKEAVETGRGKTVGTMPLRVEFAESGNALVMSDNKLCSYDTKAKKNWESDFENNLLDSFAMDEKGNTVVALRGIKNNSIIRTYTKNGKNSGEYVTETQAVHVGLNKKYVAICEKSKVSVINYSGKLVSSMEIKKEVQDIAIISNNKIVLLCNDCIQLLKI